MIQEKRIKRLTLWQKRLERTREIVRSGARYRFSLTNFNNQCVLHHRLRERRKKLRFTIDEKYTKSITILVLFDFRENL